MLIDLFLTSNNQELSSWSTQTISPVTYMLTSSPPSEVGFQYYQSRRQDGGVGFSSLRIPGFDESVIFVLFSYDATSAAKGNPLGNCYCVILYWTPYVTTCQAEWVVFPFWSLLNQQILGPCPCFRPPEFHGSRSIADPRIWVPDHWWLLGLWPRWGWCADPRPCSFSGWDETCSGLCPLQGQHYGFSHGLMPTKKWHLKITWLIITQ